MGLSRYFYMLLVGIILIGVYWANLTRIEIATHASGKVVPTGKIRTIQNLEGGIISSIYVKEGEKIDAGKTLLEFEAVASQSEVNELESHIAFLTIELLLIKATLENRSINFPKNLKTNHSDLILAGRDQFRAKNNVLKSKIRLLKNDAKRGNILLKSKKALINEKKGALNLVQNQINISEGLLAEELTSELSHLDLLRAKKKLEIEIKEARQSMKDLESEILGFDLKIQSERDIFTEELTKRYQKYNDEKHKYEKRLSRFKDELGRRVVVSPIDGIVKKVWVHTIGGVVQPGMNLIEVVPSNETLVVEAELPISDVGVVRLSQKVKVRLAGATNVEYDAITGFVDRVSPDTMKNEDGEEFYQVRILLESDSFVGGVRSFALRPGLTVDCSLIISNRSLLENLLAPFISAKTKAFSENVWNSSVEQEKWSSKFIDLLKSSLLR